jgi:hypothetical protein
MAEDVEHVENKKAKSNIWAHFWLKRNKKTNVTADGVAVCRHCGVEVKSSGGRQRILQHISTVTTMGWIRKRRLYEVVGIQSNKLSILLLSQTAVQIQNV